MKDMKNKLSALFLMLFVACSCSLNELQILPESSQDYIIVSMKTPLTKVSVDGGVSLRWDAGDNITTYPSGNVYEYYGPVDGGKAKFVLIKGDTGVSDDDVAVFGDMRCYYDAGYADIIWPEEQTYVDGSSTCHHYLIAKKADTKINEFEFENLGGYLVLSLYGDASVESVKLTPSGPYPFSGNEPTNAYRILGTKTAPVVLKAETPVRLSNDADSPTEFWFTLPGNHLSKGFSVTVTSDLHREITFSTDEFRTIERGVVHRMVPVFIDFPSDPAIILSAEKLSLSASAQSGSIGLYTDVDLKVDIDPEASWIKGYEYDAEKHVVSFNVEQNKGKDIRSTIVVFRSKDRKVSTSIKVSQFTEGFFVDITEPIHLSVDSPVYHYTCLRSCNAEIPTNENGHDVCVVDYFKDAICIQDSYIDVDLWLSVKGKTFQIVFVSPDPYVSDTQTVTVIIEDNKDEIDRERADLESMYYALNGDSWYRNTNWCSDKPIHEWEGVQVDNFGRVIHLSLDYNNLCGELPPVHFPHLDLAYLNGNHISGELHPSWGSVPGTVYLYDNEISGRIPDEVVPKLFDGSLNLSDNKLGGILPQTLTSPARWNDKDVWVYVLEGNQFEWADIPAIYPVLKKTTDLYGDLVDMEQVVHNNEYTVLFQWWGTCYPSSIYYPYLIELYEKFHDSGLEVIGISNDLDRDSDERIKKLAEERNTPWRTVRRNAPVETRVSPTLSVLDKSGKLIFYTRLQEFDMYTLKSFIGERLSAGNLYESTDYSMDGVVENRQRASIGKGLELMVLFDGMSDKDIMDPDSMCPWYASAAIEGFFYSEPLASMRDMFNVNVVYAVSKNNVYTKNSETKFSVQFGEGTHLSGNDAEVLNYARKAGPIDDATIIVIANSAKYAGTCYMYPSGKDGKGVSIAYCTVDDMRGWFQRVVEHEAAGHGFGKLADEYWDSFSLAASSDDIKELKETYHPMGFYLNVDGTSDPQKVLWGHFLSDSRYAKEGLGVYEGGHHFSSGIYRASESSVMDDNEGGFNAPSRQAIYTRAHKAVYGDDWQFDYEEFVKYDERARESMGIKNMAPKSLREPLAPLAPPVVIMPNKK